MDKNLKFGRRWPEPAGTVRDGFRTPPQKHLTPFHKKIMVRSSILKKISSTKRGGVISGQHGILIWCWDSCAFGALWWIELLLAKIGCVILHFCYDDSVRFVYWLGALCWTPPKLLGLHFWRWNKHGSKCALPDVRVCAWKCLFEQSLPIKHMHFYPLIHVWRVCFELL